MSEHIITIKINDDGVFYETEIQTVEEVIFWLQGTIHQIYANIFQDRTEPQETVAPDAE